MIAKTMSERRGVPNPRLTLLLGVLCLAVLAATPAIEAANLDGLTVIGVAPDGTETPVTDYRWLVEQDLTYHVGFDSSGNPINVPGTPGFDPNWENTLSVSFYRTYMPLVGKGCVNMPAEAACTEVSVGTLATDQHYFVSVLPRCRAAPSAASGFKTAAAASRPLSTFTRPRCRRRRSRSSCSRTPRPPTARRTRRPRTRPRTAPT